MTSSTPVTQPVATQLLDHHGLRARAEALARQPGTFVSVFGQSVEGRDLLLLTLSDTDDASVLHRYRETTKRLLRPSPDDDRTAPHSGMGAWPDDVRLPILFAGASFGDEAAHVEALVELAERMSGSPLLERIVLLVVPLMNPDGRERAIAEWSLTPGSSGSAGEANAHGQLLNRDFLYASQPETEAINRILNDWDPAVVWDAHEDAVSLGRQFDEVCLAPPTAPRPPPGITDALEVEIRRFGAAISSVWGQAGFRQLYDPDGLHGWTAPEDGAPTRMTGFIGRLAYAAGLRGSIAFITESARTIGIQSWDDRVQQKVLAGEAVARHAYDHADRLLAAITANRGDLMRKHGDSFYVLPADQDTGALHRAVRVMHLNGITMHQAAEDDAVVVLGGQPNVASLLALAGEFASHDGLRLTSNVQMIASQALNASDQAKWRSRELVSLDAMQAVSTDSVVAGGPSTATAALGSRKHVAVYSDIGATLREGSSGGSVAALLENASLPFSRITAEEIAQGRLEDYDVLIVPNGNAAMILHGFGATDTWYGPPWTPPQAGSVLGPDGQSAMVDWIRAGGTYIGIDAGGGWLATEDHLGFVNAARFGADLGLGAIELHITEPAAKPFRGCSGSYGTAGEWRPNVLHVPYGGEGHRGAGSAYRVGTGVAVLARYGVSHSIPGVPHLVNSDQLLEAPAIIEQRIESGAAILFGFDPSFRCYWSSTFPLLLSAIGAGD